jgi:hypothetical protein
MLTDSFEICYAGKYGVRPNRGWKSHLGVGENEEFWAAAGYMYTVLYILLLGDI